MFTITNIKGVLMEWVAIVILGFFVLSAHMMLKEFARKHNWTIDSNASRFEALNLRIYELEKRVEKLENDNHTLRHIISDEKKRQARTKSSEWEY